jgi:hypothetical protein
MCVAQTAKRFRRKFKHDPRFAHKGIDAGVSARREAAKVLRIKTMQSRKAKKASS